MIPNKINNNKKNDDQIWKKNKKGVKLKKKFIAYQKFKIKSNKKNKDQIRKIKK
jgi:hypothetical protein